MTFGFPSFIDIICVVLMQSQIILFVYLQTKNLHHNFNNFYKMYPPRKSGDSLSKSKNSNGYVSPSHKDANKVNKILQNAKKYQQTKQQKRDYMLQGIMNLNKKPSQQQTMPNNSNNKNGTISKQSDRQQQSQQNERNNYNRNQSNKNVYRRVQRPDSNNISQQQSQLKRNSSFKSQQGENNNSNRQLKRTNNNINYKSSDNLYIVQQQQQNYRNNTNNINNINNSGMMIRQSDNDRQKYQLQQNKSSNYSQSLQFKNDNSNMYGQGYNNNMNIQQSNSNQYNNYTNNNSNYNSNNNNNYNNISNSSSYNTNNTANNNNNNNNNNLPNNNNNSNSNSSSYTNQYSNNVTTSQTYSQRYNNNSLYNNTNTNNNNTNTNTNTNTNINNNNNNNNNNNYVSNNNNVNSNDKPIYVQTAQSNYNAVNSPRQNISAPMGKKQQHKIEMKAQLKTNNQGQYSSKPYQSQKAQQTQNNNNYRQVSNNLTANQPQSSQQLTKSKSQGQITLDGQDGQQKLFNLGIQKYNSAQTEQQKRNLAIKSYKDQQYLKKLQSGEMDNEQKDFIRTSMEKMSQQAVQMRNKFYRAEDQRVSLVEKLKIVQNQNLNLRNENEKTKLKFKNMQFQLNTLQNYKNMSENQIRQLKSNNELINTDIMNRMNDLNMQLRKKSNQFVKLQRVCSQLQAQLNERNYQLNRFKQIANKKQQQVLNLHQKQYQLNKLTSVQSKNQIQIKNYNQRIANLQSQNNVLRQKSANIPKLQAQLSKYRKQIQQMFQDMRDLEGQLGQKDRLLQQYKNYTSQQQQNTKIKLIEQQLEAIMKQKNQLIRSYEQKLLQKDKRIQQLQLQFYEQSNSSKMKLGGLQSGQAAFQQILKQQLEEINLLKRQNSARVTELFTTKIELQNAKSQLQNQMNKSKILSLQLQSGQRNANSLAQSHLKAAKNQIQSLNRRIESINSTVESKRRENQNKDQFIKNYLIGINKTNDVGMLVSQLERILTK